MSKIKTLLNSGIGRTLFTWFMLLSLIPLALTGWNVLEQSRNTLRKQEESRLVTSMGDQAAFITSFFEERLRHLDYQASAKDNLGFLNALLAAKAKSGKTTAEFVKGFEWSMLTTSAGHSNDLRDFQFAYNYPNLFLLDQAGDVIFSARPSELLGSNLMSGQMAATNLGAAVRQALISRRPVITDLEKNSMLGDRFNLFMVSSIAGEDGETVGVVVLQPSMDHLFEFLAKKHGETETHESYLVGTDRLMRSWSGSGDKATILQQKVDTFPVRQWLRENTDESHEESMEHGFAAKGAGESYVSYRGVEVLGRYSHLPVLGKLGLEWVLVSEVSVAEAYAVSNALRRDIFIQFLLTALVVLLAAGFVALRFILPLVQITGWARRIAAGDFKGEDIKVPDNELGLLAVAFSDRAVCAVALLGGNDSFQINKIYSGWPPLAQLRIKNST